MRKGATLMACVNGQEAVAPQDIEYWKNYSDPTNPTKVKPNYEMSRLPYSELDGQMSFGWLVPQFWCSCARLPPRLWPQAQGALRRASRLSVRPDALCE